MQTTTTGKTNNNIPTQAGAVSYFSLHDIGLMQTTTTGKTKHKIFTQAGNKLVLFALQVLCKQRPPEKQKTKSSHKRAISHFSCHHIGIEQSHANNNHRKKKKASSQQADKLLLFSQCMCVEAADGTDEAAGPVSFTSCDSGSKPPPPTPLSAPLILPLTTLGVIWCACGGRCATLPVHTFTHACNVLPKENQWHLLTRKSKM